MRPIKQRKGSKTCGQCCVGTILGVPLAIIIKHVGHNGPTYRRDLTKFFNSYKKYMKEPKELAICVARPLGIKSGGWHWVVSKNGKIYDPHFAKWMPVFDWELISGRRISSWNVLGKPKSLKR